MERFNLGGQFALPSNELLFDDVAILRTHEIRYSKSAATRATILAFTIMALLAGLLVVTRDENSDAHIWRLRVNAVVLLVIFCAAAIKRIPIYIRRNYADPVIIIGPTAFKTHASPPLSFLGPASRTPTEYQPVKYRGALHFT